MQSCCHGSQGRSANLPLKVWHNLGLEVEEKTVMCPICSKRKAKRLCPARAETICSVCCANRLGQGAVSGKQIQPAFC